MNTIYLNIKEAEENRIVVTRHNKLVDFEQELQGEESKKGNIYKGIVSNLEPSLEAAFVDFGDSKNGLLPLREIPANAPGVSAGGLAVGDQLLVQIKKDHIGDKGAGLTGNISLAGRFLVLRPFGQDTFGVSAAASSNERKGMSEIISSLPIPDGMGVIARSMALAHNREDIQWDLDSYLMPLWKAIQTSYAGAAEPVLIYNENDLLLRVMRDYFRPESGDIIVCDDEARYKELCAFVQMLFPDNVGQIRLHSGAENMIPAAMEQKIEQIYAREVSVMSGVRVVFDTTEALVAIDVNSGRQRQGGNIEETALKTNLEAAEIIAEQLRMRNLGGLIVIDFIDMRQRANCETLEQRMAELIRKDRARTRMSKISEFGLMEISRQRTSRSLVFSQTLPCARCNGSGQVWRENTFALHLLRKARTAAFHESTRTIVLHAPRDAGVFLLNEKRAELQEIEARSGCDVVIVPDKYLTAPQYKLKPVKGDKKAAMDVAKQVTRQEEVAEVAYTRQQQTQTQQPVLKNMLPRERMPSKQVGLGGKVSKFLSALFGGGESAAKPHRGSRTSSSRGGGGGKPASNRQQAQSGKKADSRSSRGGRQRNRGGEGGRQRPARAAEDNAVAAESKPADNAPRRNNTPPPRKEAAPQNAALSDKNNSNGKAVTPPVQKDTAPQNAAAGDKSGGSGKPAAPSRKPAVPQDAAVSDKGGKDESNGKPPAPARKEAAPQERVANGKDVGAAPPPKEAQESKAKDGVRAPESAAPAAIAKPSPAPAASAPPAAKSGNASPSSSQAVVLPPIVKKPAADAPAPAPASASTPPASAPQAAPPPPAASAPAQVGSGWVTPGADVQPPRANRPPQEAERTAE